MDSGLKRSLWDSGRAPIEVSSDASSRAAEPDRSALQGISASMAVLASSSSGNCSVLIHGEGDLRRATLIDCGLSPLRTRRLLANFGLTLAQVDDILVTHLDSDHFQPNWVRAKAGHTRIRLHARHAARARGMGLSRLAETAARFDGEFEIAGGVRIAPTLLEHDEWGVVAFRMEWGGGAASLGYATDVGRLSESLVSSMRGVDVLAIESNYCPIMQDESDRPAFLKRRIMGGAGHLSNEQCRRAVQLIQPRRHVVLLHLSRECNRAERAAECHAGAAYGLTVAHHERSTGLVGVVG